MVTVFCLARIDHSVVSHVFRSRLQSYSPLPSVSPQFNIRPFHVSCSLSLGLSELSFVTLRPRLFSCAPNLVYVLSHDAAAECTLRVP